MWRPAFHLSYKEIFFFRIEVVHPLEVTFRSVTELNCYFT